MPASKAAKASIADSDQVRLLGRLASQDKTSISITKAIDILKTVPEWAKYETEGLLPPDSSRILRQLHSACLLEQGKIIAESPAVVRTLVQALKITDNAHPVQYVLSLFYEVVRNDTNKYDVISAALVGENVYETLIKLTDDRESYTADKASFFLSGLISRAPAGTFSDDQVKNLVERVLRAKGNFSELGKLDTLCNILKLDEKRDIVWDTKGFMAFLQQHLSPSRSVPSVYRAAFCVWLLSFNTRFIKPLLNNGLLQGICKLLNECRTEKVVRICIHTLTNFLGDDDAVELIIEENSVQVLTLLEYEKWRDAEMYDEIREGLHHLHMKINQFSNFARYRLELEKETLKWSFLHSEKFWHENVMHFEENEFEVVKKLAGLLSKQDDPSTVCVACHDLGEFARLHPAGKQICGKLMVKDKIMALMQGQQREVGREALLACQKLMLQRWQDVQKPVTA